MAYPLLFAHLDEQRPEFVAGAKETNCLCVATTAGVGCGLLHGQTVQVHEREGFAISFRKLSKAILDLSGRELGFRGFPELQRGRTVVMKRVLFGPFSLRHPARRPCNHRNKPVSEGAFLAVVTPRRVLVDVYGSIPKAILHDFHSSVKVARESESKEYAFID
jgi:hypothetical protein